MEKGRLAELYEDAEARREDTRSLNVIMEANCAIMSENFNGNLKMVDLSMAHASRLLKCYIIYLYRLWRLGDSKQY